MFKFLVSRIIPSTVYLSVCLIAPVSVIAINSFGARNTVAVCTVAAVLGVVLSGYAQSLWHIILSYSILTSK